MDGLRERVVRQRARFIEDYDDYIDQARLDLGKLFRIEDYPSKEDLQGKFAIRYRITPVPDADHFIAQLASDDTERVKRDIESHIEEQLHGAVGDLYRRFGEAVERVSERLQGGRRRQAAGVPGHHDLEHPRPGRRGAASQHLRRRDPGAALRAGEGEDRERRARRAASRPRPSTPWPAAQVKRDADDLAEKFAGYFGARDRARAGGRLMAARVLERIRAPGQRLRDGSAAQAALLREPRAEAPAPARSDTRDAGDDGHEIRYSPQWVANTEAHLIETAMARVVMACALKHHTRRGERDPERWQMASQLVTHALIRDAGFTLPPDAEAWDDLSVEQAYDRLPTPRGRRSRGRR